MTEKVFTLTAAVMVLLVGGWLAVAAAGRPQALRSRHSEPATTSPQPLVAVTAAGKLYHRSDCAFIHGPAQMESGEEAIAAGYAPCTRCWKGEPDSE